MPFWEMKAFVREIFQGGWHVACRISIPAVNLGWVWLGLAPALMPLVIPQNIQQKSAKVMSAAKSWLPQQDHALMELRIHRRIQSWSKITSILAEQFNIQNKTPKKCRERFNNHLNPDIARHDWTQAEQALLLALHNQMGNSWAQISRRIPGRNDNAVKNKLYSKFRKSLKNVNILMRENTNGRWKDIQISFIYKIMLILQKGQAKSYEEEGEIIKMARVIKNEIITFENVNGNTASLTLQIQRRLEQLTSNILWLNTNFKKRSFRKKTKKDGQEEYEGVGKWPLPAETESCKLAIQSTQSEDDKELDLSSDRLASDLFLPHFLDRLPEPLPIFWGTVYRNEEDRFWDVDCDSYSF